MLNFLRFFTNLEKPLKNGLYIDYFFKNIIFYFNKIILGNNFIYLSDKYLTEKVFFFFKNFFSFFQNLLQNLKNMNYKQLIKIIFIITIQILILIIL